MDTIVLKPNEALTLSKNIIIHYQSTFQIMRYNLENLQKISILTADTGPLYDDVALALFFVDEVCVLPSEHSSYQELYDSLSKSLTLNYETVIKAMRCTENNEFVIWER